MAGAASELRELTKGLTLEDHGVRHEDFGFCSEGAREPLTGFECS